MHVGNEADESNRETEYNYETENEDDNDSDPMSGACFCQVYHHMNNDVVRFNPYWILLNNHITVQMFRNRAILANIPGADDPIGVYSNGGVTHCRKERTLNNIGKIYLHENGLANIFSYAKVRDKHNITYSDVQEIFTVHAPYKRIHFQRSKRGMYYNNCKPNGKKRDVTFVHTVEESRQGFTNSINLGHRKGKICIQNDETPISSIFRAHSMWKHVKNFPISVTNIKTLIQPLALASAPSAAKQ